LIVSQNDNKRGCKAVSRGRFESKNFLLSLFLDDALSLA